MWLLMFRLSAAVGWRCAFWVLRTAIPFLFWLAKNRFAHRGRVLNGASPLWTSAGRRRRLKFPKRNSPKHKQRTTTRARCTPNSSRNAHRNKKQGEQIRQSLTESHFDILPEDQHGGRRALILWLRCGTKNSLPVESFYFLSALEGFEFFEGARPVGA